MRRSAGSSSSRVSSFIPTFRGIPLPILFTSKEIYGRLREAAIYSGASKSFSPSPYHPPSYHWRSLRGNAGASWARLLKSLCHERYPLIKVWKTEEGNLLISLSCLIRVHSNAESTTTSRDITTPFRKNEHFRLTCFPCFSGSGHSSFAISPSIYSFETVTFD